MNRFSINRLQLLAGAVVVLGISAWALANTSRTDTRSTIHNSKPQVAGESTVAPESPLPSPTASPQSTHNVITKDEGNTHVHIENQSSQSGSSNSNTSRTSVTVNGQTTTVINGVEQ